MRVPTRATAALPAIAVAIAVTALVTAPGRPSAAIWISANELAELPMSGSAWDALESVADDDAEAPSLKNYTSNHDVSTLAQALVAVRLGLTAAGSTYRSKAADNIMSAIGTEEGSSALPNARNTTAYVIAADLIDLETFRPEQELLFRTWITRIRYRCFGERSFYSASEDRPNNWGLMNTAARLAIAVYLRDHGGAPEGQCNSFPECNPSDAARLCSDPGAEIARIAKVFEGWTGNRGAYAGFTYGELDWQSDRNKPVGINPVGATIDGKNVDGVLPDDQRRGGDFEWPPPKENYVYEALQAALVTAVMLHRLDYDVWNWSDKALLRAFEWLHEHHFEDGSSYPATGDDRFQPHLVNHYYGTSFPAPVPCRSGKLMGYTDWTHGEARARRPPEKAAETSGVEPDAALEKQ